MHGPRPNHPWFPAIPCIAVGQTIHRVGQSMNRVGQSIHRHPPRHARRAAPPCIASFRAMSGVCLPTLLSTASALLFGSPLNLLHTSTPHPRISLLLRGAGITGTPSNGSSHAPFSVFTVLLIPGPPGPPSILAHPQFIECAQPPGFPRFTTHRDAPYHASRRGHTMHWSFLHQPIATRNTMHHSPLSATMVPRRTMHPSSLHQPS
ncbi:hypothetical protein BDZ89DRAFT_721598 [Hymenopellis radicata]|nr:hypothetical protein BDZ89DRAFT_721598 [Hymenopellis radicata]